MKFPIWLSRLLAYTQICIGLCLTTVAASMNNFFYFTIGLFNILSGVIVTETIKQGGD